MTIKYWMFAGRLERGARWLVPALVVLTAAHGVYAAQGLFGDGSFYLLNILHTDSFYSFDPARYFAPIVTQAPVIATSRLGVTDVATLIRMHSLGVVAIPLLLWIAAFAVQWNRPFYWPLVAIFAVVELNSGFMAVGEYRLAYALVVLSTALLLRVEPLGWPSGLVLVLSAVVLTRSYEALVYLGPFLLLLVAARFVGVPVIGSARSRAERSLLALLAVAYVYATVVAAASILDPRDPQNARNAANILVPLLLNPQFGISAALAALAIGLPLLTRDAVLTVAVATAAIVLTESMLWAHPAMHYMTRTLAGLALFVLLTAAVTAHVVATRRDRDGSPRNCRPSLTWLPAATLLCLQMIPFAVLTSGFANWTRDFEHIVLNRSGQVLIADAGLDPLSTARYEWWWTNRVLSVLLREHPDQAMILSRAGDVAATAGWLPDPLPEPLPKFTKRGQLFG